MPDNKVEDPKTVYEKQKEERFKNNERVASSLLSHMGEEPVDTEEEKVVQDDADAVEDKEEVVEESDAGDADDVQDEEESDEPEADEEEAGLSASLLIKAARLGIEEADIVDCQNDKELSRLIRFAEKSSTSRQKSEQQEQVEEEQAFKIDLPMLDLPEGEYDEDLRKSLQDYSAKNNAVLETLMQRLNEAKSSAPNVGEIEQREFVHEFDLEVNDLGDAYRDAFGRGFARTVKGDQLDNRGKLFEAASVIVDSERAKGRDVSLGDAVKAALGVQFPDLVKKANSSVIIKKSKSRTKVRKPGGVKTGNVDPKLDAINAIDKKLADLGLETRRVTTSSDMEEYIKNRRG